MSVQEKINKILWDRRYVQIPDRLERPKDFPDCVLLKDIRLPERNRYLFVKEREEHVARQAGVPTEAEILSDARVGGYWTEHDDLVLKEADDHVSFLRSEMEAKKKFPSRIKMLERQIEKAERQKVEVEAKKHELYSASAEYLAHEIAVFELVKSTVLSLDGQPVWQDDASFMHFKKEYFPLLIFLVQEVMGEGLLEAAELREIARSPDWRLVWTLNRENLPGIFNRSVGDLTLNHKLLIYWSRVYDSALETTEPPDDDVLNDDDRFDQWLANRDLERAEKDDRSRLSTKDHTEQINVLDGEYIETCTCGAKEKNIGVKGLGERVMHDRTCPYGTWRQYSPAERDALARQIYDRNSKRVRQVMDNEQEAITSHGLVQEQHLRGKKTRHMLGMQTKVTSKGRR